MTLYRMSRAGAPFICGGKSNVDWLLEWLRENPNFNSPVRAKKKSQSAAPVISAHDLALFQEVQRLLNFEHIARFVREVPELYRQRGTYGLFERGVWKGQPAHYGFVLDRRFAIVCDLEGSWLGVWYPDYSQPDHGPYALPEDRYRLADGSLSVLIKGRGIEPPFPVSTSSGKEN